MNQPNAPSQPNRLGSEKSPYLLQHAYNPVDWHTWGPEAFALAKEMDRPIFLSVGYSTCHWCHVMAHESFEDAETAQLLNEHFVSIKVDREERPDVDEIYMSATQAMTGRGGWPNSVFLTSDGRPWFAGTYFPPEDHAGQIGFKSLLRRLAELWQTRRQDVEAQADSIASAVREFAAGGAERSDGKISRTVMAAAIDELRSNIDREHGGLSGEPKFPPHQSLALLLYEYRRTQDLTLLHLATLTLDAMAMGGIYDHVGGGFHRYSTDERWFLPHFEKMLYDNAMLIRAYADAYDITRSEDYRRVATETADWVLREMSNPAGGFYSAVDADSEGIEGKFYLWSQQEILDILGEEEDEFFCRAFGVMREGNLQREQGESGMAGLNILYLPHSLELAAKIDGIDVSELRRRLSDGLLKLRQRREQRVHPSLDDTILTSWNGLMIGALAYAGAVLAEPRYITAAQSAADFLLQNLRDDGGLLASFRGGAGHLRGYLDDYVFLADGLLDLYEVTENDRWLDEARQLMDVVINHFQDMEHGGYFFTRDDHETLLARVKNPFDRALPSGSGIAARVLVRLGEATGERHYDDLARETFAAFWLHMQRAPLGTQSLILACAMSFDRVGAEEVQEGQEGTARGGPVSVEAFASHRAIIPGQEFHVALRVSIDEGCHINSNQPLQDYLLPTSVTLRGSEYVSAGTADYPFGKIVHGATEEETLSVFEGSVWIEVPVRLSRQAPYEPLELTLELHAQPCTATECLPPVRLSIPLRIEVTPDALQDPLHHPEIFERFGVAG